MPQRTNTTMRYVLWGVTILLFILGNAWLLTSTQKRKTAVIESPISMLIVLRAPLEVNTGVVANAYRRQWGGHAACAENLDWADPQKQSHAYLLTDGACSLLLTTVAITMPNDLLDEILKDAPHLDTDQRTALRAHKGFMIINEVQGSAPPSSQARFAAQSLITMLQSDYVIGYVDTPAHRYWPKSHATPLLHKKKLSVRDIETLLVTIRQPAAVAP